MVRRSAVQKQTRAKAVTTMREEMRGVRTATTSSATPVKSTGSYSRPSLRKAKIRL